MTNYTKSTDFAVKDVLLTGNPNKLVKGSEVDVEFTNLELADATNVKKTGTTGSAIIPVGTTAQRDASPAVGYTRVNTTTGTLEWWDGTIWTSANGGDAYDLEVTTATAGQTVITTASSFVVGSHTLMVYLNGLLVNKTSDYTETTTNSFTFNSGLTAGDEVVAQIWRTNIATSGDALTVTYTPAGTGAVATTVQTKLRESVSVKDFGAKGDGVTDDTASIQAAITYLQPIGGILLFPAGTYKVTSSLNWVSTVNTGLPGIFFQGAGGTGGVYGGATTTIKSYIASGPLFQIQGTKTQASGGTGSLFINGGGISGMCLDGTNATGTSQAIRVNGWQYAEIVDVTIQKFPGDGVTQYTDAGYPNGDYSSSTINFKNCWIVDNGGNGINQTGYVGAWSWQFNKTLFAYNGNGAVITSAGNSFVDCSFVGSGFSLAGVVRTGGIHIQAGVSTGSISRLMMRGCEFDFARLKHVTLDYIQTVSISESRFIFNDRNATGSMTPSVGLDIAPASAASTVQSILVDRCNMRIDTVGTLSGFKLSNVSNVYGITVKDPVWSDNTGGAATITKYSGFTTSNFNLRSGYLVTENTAVVIPGKPAPYVLMTTVAGQTVNTATFDNIIFGTQETVNAQIYPAGTSAGVIYNTSTGVFTAPQTGFYEVSCQLNFSGMTSADTVRTQITTTAGGAISFDGLGSAPSSGVFGFVIPTTKVFCAAGDTIQISARMGGTARALSTTASYASRLLIQMMP